MTEGALKSYYTFKVEWKRKRNITTSLPSAFTTGNRRYFVSSNNLNNWKFKLVKTIASNFGSHRLTCKNG